MRGEDGAVALIFALLLIVLLGFAAVAVDLGAVWVERRHAQTAADVGALSGAQFAEGDRQAVIDEVEDITVGNLDSADWATCVDAGRPPEFTPVAGQTDCVSFTFGLEKIRVRVPDQAFDTYFAGVIGVDTLSTSASAEVTADISQSGDILPFGIPSTDSSATIGCPSDHPNGLYPCNGPDSGNFNHLNITQWGGETTPHDCTYSNNGFQDNLAAGVDHLLGEFGSNPVHDQDACNDPALANYADPPGTVQSKTGVAQSLLAPGLITGSPGGFDGRLTEIRFGPTPSPILGHTLDNEPLWNFIGGTVSGVPANCLRGSFNNATSADQDWDEDLWVSQGGDPLLSPEDDPDYDGTPQSLLEEPESFEHMARCLREYVRGDWDIGTFDPGTWDPVGNPGNGYSGTASTGVLFNTAGPGTDPEKGIYDLQLSPRWGWSPIGPFSSGTNPFPITRFVPIYIQTLVSGCNANSCGWIWQAGETPPSGNPNGNKIQSLVSFQLTETMVPAEVFTYGPGAEFELQYTLTK